ncbi:MAG: hypothetical protein JNL04_18435 [Rhodospirillaceae bacterium]|nr:hypothetical protein [Rhodospirillaceae bacterium]
MALSLLAIGLGWFLFYWHASVVRETALGRAHASAVAQSQILREYVEQVLTSAAVGFRSLDTSPERPGIQIGGDPLANHLLLRRLRDSSPLYEGIGLIDGRGDVWVNADADVPTSVNLADRDYFIHHRDDPRTEIMIAEPVASRPSGVWAIPVSRRIEDEQGRFAGVIAARLRPTSFERLFEMVGAKRVVLFRDDGVVLASYPPLRADSRLEDLGIPLARISGPSGSSIDSDGPSQDVRLMGFSRSDSFPIGVVVTFAVSTVLADLNQDLGRLAWIATASTVMIVLLAALLVGRVRRQLRLAEALEEALVAAESANRSKSTFLAHMSHELRTPLNAIIGFGEVMSAEMFGPMSNLRYLEYADLIKRSGSHLLSIINNILDMAKVDAGKWDLDVKPVAVQAVARDLHGFVKARAEDHQVALAYEIPPDLAPVTTDRQLLLQILINLTTNAIKFTLPGGTVTVSARHTDDGAAVTVADTGIGMSQEDLQRVLNPFGRASSDLARLRQDTGLGLPLSKRFAELLGGRLEIETAPGKGTRATVWLPPKLVPQGAPA